MAGMIRTKVAEATSSAYADGADLMAGLLARPMARREPEPEPQAPEPTSDLLAGLLAKPRAERTWEEPEPAPVVVAEPLPLPVAPPVPMPKPGRVLRTRATVVSEVERQLIHGEFDQLLAESVAAMPANKRWGKCKVCGAAKGVCDIGPFWGD